MALSDRTLPDEAASRREELAVTLRIVLLLAVVVPLVIAVGFARSTRRQIAEGAQQQLKRTAALAAEHSLKVLEGSEAILAEISQFSSASGQNSKERHLKRLDALVDQRSQVVILGIADRNGDIVLSAPMRGPLNVSWRDYFSFHRSDRLARPMFVGHPIIGRTDTAFTVPLSIRIDDENGNFGGVAFLALDRNYMRGFFEEMSASVADSIGLISTSDVFLATWSKAVDNELDQNIVGARLRQAPKDATGLGLVEVKDRDGKPQLVAFKSVGEYGLYAYVSQSVEAIEQSWRDRMLATLPLLVLPIIGLFIAAYIAERKIREINAAVTALVANKARYKSIFKSSPDCIFLLKADGDGEHVFLDVNDNSLGILGFAAEHVVGKRVGELFKPAEAAFFIAACQACLKSGGVIQKEHQVAPSSTMSIYWDLRVLPLAGQPETVIGSVRNVSKQKLLMMSLRDLTVRLLQRQDRERRHFARELHDSAAQNLLAASLEIKLASDALSAGNGVAKNGAWHCHLSRSRDFIESTQKEIRSVSYLLHPPMLDEAGLPNALKWLVEGFQRRTNISFDLTIAPSLEEARFPVDVELALFRVAQEALANVHRHANARTAKLFLAIDADDVLEFRIEDDGTSEPGASRSMREGVGISGMRQRLMALDGTLTFQMRERGAVVTARLPLIDKAA